MDTATPTLARNPEALRAAPPEFGAVKARQQTAWSSGDYAVIGTTLQIVGEQLCETVDVRAGSKVLDIAAGNGNASLAAARRGCDVVATDYVPSLLERARERAAAERLDIEFREADAEALPFGDGEFDVVLSTFGVMFTPDQDRAAAEMIRVCRRAAKSDWPTDAGWIYWQRLKTIGKYVAPPASQPPSAWGRALGLQNCLSRTLRRSNRSSETSCFVIAPRAFHRGLQDVLRAVLKTFGALDARGRPRCMTIC